MPRKRILGLFGPLLLLCTPGVAMAAGSGIDTGDTAWMLAATALVLFMTLPGLALFYGGLVRSRNVLSVLMQCFTIACMVSVLWLIILYSLTFTPGNDWIGGLSRVMMGGLGRHQIVGHIPESVFAMYELAFAVITPALIVGAFAERIKFSVMLWFSALWVCLVYAPIAHWVWGGGWLGKLGLMDFAGGTVVHVTAGVSALIGALLTGPRTGFPRSAMMPHNMTMTLTGAGMLWVGWFGFNAGSALSAGGGAGMAMLVTHMSAAAGALTWMSAEWWRHGRPSALGVVTGMVAGLGAITPASGYAGPAGALVIGACAGAICFWATHYFKNRLHIDDSLDVFTVHGVGGIVGTLLTGVFASTLLGVFSGAGYPDMAGMARQVGIQALGVIVTGVYAGGWTFVILKGLDAVIGLRVTPEEESQGLDLVLHEERGYDI